MLDLTFVVPHINSPLNYYSSVQCPFYHSLWGADKGGNHPVCSFVCMHVHLTRGECEIELNQLKEITDLVVVIYGEFQAARFCNILLKLQFLFSCQNFLTREYYGRIYNGGSK